MHWITNGDLLLITLASYAVSIIRQRPRECRHAVSPYGMQLLERCMAISRDVQQFD